MLMTQSRCYLFHNLQLIPFYVWILWTLIVIEGPMRDIEMLRYFCRVRLVWFIIFRNIRLLMIFNFVIFDLALQLVWFELSLRVLWRWNFRMANQTIQMLIAVMPHLIIILFWVNSHWIHSANIILPILYRHVCHKFTFKVVHICQYQYRGIDQDMKQTL